MGVPEPVRTARGLSGITDLLRVSDEQAFMLGREIVPVASVRFGIVPMGIGDDWALSAEVQKAGRQLQWAPAAGAATPTVGSVQAPASKCGLILHGDAIALNAGAGARGRSVVSVLDHSGAAVTAGFLRLALSPAGASETSVANLSSHIWIPPGGRLQFSGTYVGAADNITWLTRLCIVEFPATLFPLCC